MNNLSAFYWKGKSNFGDMLTPLLLEQFSGISTHHAPVEEAQIVVVGSVLEALPPDWSGVIAGAGKMFESTELKLDSAEVYGIRGALTAIDIQGDYILGDPGLLADELVSPERGMYELGLVPHWSDKLLPTRFAQYHPRIISPHQDALTVIKEIGRCKKIVSSSLHGLIVADAFGIPRRAEMFPQAHREGGDFKFRDYASVIGQQIEFGKLQTPFRWRIEKIQRELFDMFEFIGGKFGKAQSKTPYLPARAISY